MSTKTKVIATLVVFALVGLMLNPNAPLGAAIFGTPPESDHGPTGGQIAALMVVALVESLAFGLGFAFLLFGLPAVRRAVPHAGPARAVWLATTWALVSWVPHTALHQTVGEDFAKLVAIEYAFHVTLVLGAAAIAWALVTRARAPTHARPTPDTADA